MLLTREKVEERLQEATNGAMLHCTCCANHANSLKSHLEALDEIDRLRAQLDKELRMGALRETGGEF